MYDDFKNDFYPGELVTVTLDDGAPRANARIREKTVFPGTRRPDGSIDRKGHSRYFVSILGDKEEQRYVEEDELSRDRKVFTKMMLRSFLKNSITREAWTGAPWLVKEKLAAEYRIDVVVPYHLRHSTKIAERKAAAAAARKAANAKTDQNGQIQFWANPDGFRELKPAVRNRGRPSYEQLLAEEQYDEYHKAILDSGLMPLNGPLPPNSQFVAPNGISYPIPLQPVMPPPGPVILPPPPPAIKYPIEDMDTEPLRDGKQRPPIKYLSEDIPVSEIQSDGLGSGIKMHSVGPLLETWNTLNVYSQVYQLDSFTFDDFLEAVQFSSDDFECELFVEIHCGVLKLLVKSENDNNGAVQISLPDLPSEEDDEEGSDLEESRLPTPEPEPEIPERRTTRSSLAKAEAEALALKAETKSPSPDILTHRAAEMNTNYSWVDRLRRRDFKKGGWQIIMAGLIHQMAARPRMEAICEEILKHLAPLDAEPTAETAAFQYSTMDINLRVKALQIICLLSVETKAIKDHMEECSSLMTQHRKTKIEHQRARKSAMEELRRLHEERKALAPEKSPTPPPELEQHAEGDMTIEDSEHADTEDEGPIPSRSLRRGADREAERKRKRDQEEERKKREEEAKHSKGSKEYLKVLKKIDQEKTRIAKAEDEIVLIDEELRQLDCARTRVLGKDRFCNRYYWFERNAMSPEGNEDSSTADCGYANGRLWIQGPDDLERVGYLDVPQDLEHNYHRAFGITPNERKALEEGPTSVFTATQWGYIDDSESVDQLMEWLDVRGHRELKLRKELASQRDIIIKFMDKRKAYLAENDEEEDSAAVRMSTRTKTYVSTSAHRCLRWKNDTALVENGHRHYDPPPKPRGKGSSKKQVVVDDGVSTRATNRQGKTLTRQGTRYNF